VYAIRLAAWGRPPVLAELPEPVPGPGEVVVRVTAAGVCHSDLHVLDAGPGALPFQPPFTLGHEIAGQVAALGDGCTGFAVGDPVAVYGAWGCGACEQCASGAENYCDRRAELGWVGAGLGIDGGMATSVLVPATRLLVPLGDLDPVLAAPLTDAALTPYHAIGRIRHRLVDGAVVLVIGAGGLGHLAVQLLRALTPARVLVVDRRPDALALARRCGAHHAIAARPGADRELRTLAGGRGADAVLDFVGAQSTVDLAAAMVRSGGDLVIVGSAGGRLAVTKPSALPAGVAVHLPYWGTRGELAEVVDLARRGVVRVEVERHGLDRATEVFERLRAGRVRGRAVLTPP
jgi:alcohol dehydrogenase, propanol-preferring